MSVSGQRPQSISPEEYLQRERTAVQKSEYFAGEVFLMAGASPNHNRIVANVSAELNLGLRGSRCEAFNSDQRLFVKQNGLYTYPDLMAVCGRIEFDLRDKDSITNPVLIVEVLSPSTANYDRGGKFELYRDISSFAEYVLIHQDKIHVAHHRRDAQNRWLMTEFKALEDELPFETVGLAVPLARVYERVDWLIG